MNIFYLDKDPIIAAQMQCDKHVVKMVVESAQMLSTTHRIIDGSLERRKSISGKTMSKYYALPDSRENVLYKAVHMKHPCTIWTCQSNNNYNWHYVHWKALCSEYAYRYGKRHNSEVLLDKYLVSPPHNIEVGYKTPLPLAMGSGPECIDYNDPISSYRKFYMTKQKNFNMVWTKREMPSWFIKVDNDHR